MEINDDRLDSTDNLWEVPMMPRHKLLIPILLIALHAVSGAAEPDPGKLVKAAFDHFRGQASESVVRMTIHRPDWERTMTIRAWTEGTEDSLFTIIEPPKDRGNGTLKKGSEMWMYNPKVNRVIKLPPSMMAQSWMGSDFSNNDLAKSDSLLNHYTHTLDGTETHDGKTVYRIRSTPKPGAPVVWGSQRLKIREDHILLEERFYDEDGVLVKALTASEIHKLGGRLYPRIWKMAPADKEDEYTRLEYQELTFKADLPDRLFTVSALKHPGR